MSDQNGFRVRGDGTGADSVKVTLHEFAKAAALGIFAPPDRGDVIPLEGRAERSHMLGREAGQWDGKIEPQADVATTVVLKAIELLIGFGASLAEEDIEIFE